MTLRAILWAALLFFQPSAFLRHPAFAADAPKTRLLALDLKAGANGEKIPVQLAPVELPSELPDPPELAIILTSKISGLTALLGKQAQAAKDNRITLTVRLLPGDATQRITIIDNSGTVAEYDLRSRVEAEQASTSAAPPPPAKAFVVTGPIAYSRKIKREGTAIANPSDRGAWTLGVRAVYRRRLIREITDLLPGSPKIFFDGTGVFGRSLSGSDASSGWPRWLDARLTVELFAVERLRLEAGFGGSYFSPGLSFVEPGDLEQFISAAFSVRFGYPVTNTALAFFGANVAIPSTITSADVALVSQPMDFFIAVSWMIRPARFLEFRLRHYRVSTSGTALGSGTYSRLETFTGPEVLWVWQL